MAGVKGKGKLFTEQEFNIIKKLLNSGLNFKEASSITGRSTSLIGYVNQSEDFAGYKDIDKNRRLSQPKVVAKTEAKIEEPKDFNINERIVVSTIQSVADAINRLADILEQDTPIQKAAKEYKLFRRN
jgi:hypothetical protein